MILKYLIGLAMLAVSPNLAAEDGWAPVEPRVEAGREQFNVDPDLWVLFTKKAGDERVLVSFPGEPDIEVSQSGDFLARAEKGGEIFEMVILESGDECPEGGGSFLSEGKWVREKIVKTDANTYRLRVYSDEVKTPGKEKFIQSFSIFS